MRAQVVLNKTPYNNCTHFLHKHLGHANFGAISKILDMLGRDKVSKCSNFPDCQICKKVKAKAYPLAKTRSRVTCRPLELVHMDVLGKMPTSLSGRTSALCFVDDFSHICLVFTMQRKSEVFGVFRTWCLKTQKQLGFQLASIQMDCGGFCHMSSLHG